MFFPDCRIEGHAKGRCRKEEAERKAASSNLSALQVRPLRYVARKS
jgi:hypothetical protein